jgi:hypothetical protein
VTTSGVLNIAGYSNVRTAIDGKTTQSYSEHWTLVRSVFWCNHGDWCHHGNRTLTASGVLNIAGYTNVRTAIDAKQNLTSSSNITTGSITANGDIRTLPGERR